MDKLSQVRGVLRGIKNIAVQGIYAETFKGMESQCVSTYRKCIATLKTIEGYEEVDSLAPELTDAATMQEIGFAVETILSLINEGTGPVTGRGMRHWMPPTPPCPPIPPIPPMPNMRHMRQHMHGMRHQIRQQFRNACMSGHGPEHSRHVQELQDEMQEKIEEEQERFEDNIEKLEDQMEELQEKIEEMREHLEERLEEIREKYEEKVEEIQEAAEEAEEEADEDNSDEPKF
jgi:flagellar capping protein FliD